jgi:hypothetical protein
MPIPARRRTFGASVSTIAVAVAISGWTPHLAVAQAGRSAVAAPDLSPELQRVRAGLERYQDPLVAVREGYFSTVACVEFRKGGEGTVEYAPGGMGVHFLNLQLLGPALDPAKPQVLIYEPVGDRLRLAAAEWFVPTDVAGGKRPTIFGQELQGPMEGHEPLQPKGLHHYDLHVWLWKHNPAGVYAPTNAAVKCPKGTYSFTEHAPKLVNASGH